MAHTENDCLEHLKLHEKDYVETHGLDCGPYERWTDTWFECAVCGEKYTKGELNAIDVVTVRPGND